VNWASCCAKFEKEIIPMKMDRIIGGMFSFFLIII